MSDTLREHKVNNKGFSLVEVLVTIAIVGIIATLIGAIITQGSRFYSRERNTINLQNDLQECSNKIVDVLMGANSVEREDFADSVVIKVVNNKPVVRTRIIYYLKPSGTSTVGSLYVFENAIPAAGDSDEWDGCCLSTCVESLSIDIDETSHPYITDSEGNTVRDTNHVSLPVILNISVKVSNEKNSKSDSKTITLRNNLESFKWLGTEMVP